MKNFPCYLPDFQKFLIHHQFSTSKQAPFFAYWVHLFLNFSNQDENSDLDLRTINFTNHLKTQRKITPWQCQQVQSAIQIYFNYFLKKNENGELKRSPDFVIEDFQEILDKLREKIRLRHFSFSTEKTYLDWTGRFFQYVQSLNNNSSGKTKISQHEVQGFLTYLAIKKNVSSSTQNQAFCALLFLFRNVLHIDLTKMEKTLRAKRGPKLPVVLTIDEIILLFQT
jgi:hypothetical protein